MKQYRHLALSFFVFASLTAASHGQTATAEISVSEQQSLQFMIEEEKLARDVYTELGAKWGRPFSNIVRAEQTHMDTVKSLLDRYRIANPTLNLAPGKFVNKDLATLYTTLVKQGNVSRVEALKAGALIEELDLADLARHGRTTTRKDIQTVYDNLARGSRNHLRAFMRSLKAAGGTYTPKHLTQAEFDKIVSSPTERGGGGSGS